MSRGSGSLRLEIDQPVKRDAVVPFDAFDALAARGVFVPTGNSHKGGHQLLAAILSAEESLLRGRPAKTTANAVQLALSRKHLTDGVSVPFTPTSSSPSNSQRTPVDLKFRALPEGWSEWLLPRGRYGVTVLLRLSAGTDVEPAKAFLAERAFLPASDVAGLAPKPGAFR